MSEKVAPRKLYEVESKKWYMAEDGYVFFFDHLDGAYAFCLDAHNNVVHFSGATPVYDAVPPL